MLDFLHPTHPSWHSLLKKALATLPPNYLKTLDQTPWLPGRSKLLKAFSLPLPELKYILFGESPYPRPQSANGYAFWDQAVSRIWSETGLDKTLNRATSLRNFIKMLLVAEGYLAAGRTTPADIQALDHRQFIQTLPELFQGLLSQGFLLLNTSLVLSPRPKTKEAAIWQPFMKSLLADLAISHPHLQLLLFGKISEKLLTLPTLAAFQSLVAEHPYNLSFIQNPEILRFFAPLHLLSPL